LESVNAAMARGAAWNVLFRVADRTIGLLSTVILARLLVPADFGLVALATALFGLLALLGDFGFDIALIQNPRAERRHFDTVWTFNVIVGLATALALVALAHPLAHGYDEPRLVPIVYALAVTRAVSCFENIGIVALRKDMAFDREFRFSLYKRLATTFLATIPLAFLWRDYRALVGGTIAGSCFGLALSYLLHPYRPRLSLAAMRELLGYSKWLQLANIVAFASGRAADFIIARMAGAAALGFFTIAKEIARLPSTELAAPIHRGVFPGYAKVAADPILLKSAYLKVVSVIVLVVFPAGIGLSLVADPVVAIFFGEKWSDMAPLIQILAVNGVLGISLSTAAYVFLAQGTPRHTTTMVVFQAVVSIVLMLWLVPRSGVRGAAVAMLVSTIAAVPLNFRLMSNAVGLTTRDIWTIAWRPATATLVMVGAVLIVAQQGWSTARTLQANALNLVAAVTIGACVYGGTVFLLWRIAAPSASAEAFVLQRFQGGLVAFGRFVRALRKK